MTFGAPLYFGLLALVGLSLIFVGWWVRWRARALRALQPAERRSSRVLHLISPLLLIGAVALAVVAAARPQFGERTQETEERGIDIAIVLDVSRSMDAQDATPSRLAAAQAGLAALLGEIAGDRVGLVVFAGEALVRSPLTSDLEAIQALLRGVPEERGLLAPGSDLGAGIESGRRLLRSGESRSKAMIIVSDGEDHGSTLDSSITRAIRDGVALYTIGIGSVEGAPVIDMDVDTGVARPRTESGVSVITRLEEEALSSIAGRGGGRYIAAGVDGAAIADVSGDLAALDATTLAVTSTSLPIERFQLFAALALLLADIELLWRILPVAASGRRLVRLWPLAAPTIFIAAICSTSTAEVNERGNDAYDRGEYAQALDAYRTAEAGGGPRGEIAYNAGNSLHQTGRYDEAIEEARRALAALDSSAVAEYGLGSHFAADGQFAGALEAFKRALLLDPDDADSKHNLEVVSILLTPTIAVTQAPALGTPTAGAGEDDATGGTSAPDPGGTSEPGQSTNNSTPSVGGTPGAPSPEEQLSDDELARALDEALAGIEQEFTEEEALELLRLLDEQNRRSVGDSTGDVSRPGQPDY